MRNSHLSTKKNHALGIGAGIVLVLSVVLLFTAESSRAAVIVDTGVDGGPNQSLPISLLSNWPTRCRDTLTCELPDRLQSIDVFLRMRKVGLYTPDPRPLEPTAEVIRLNIVPQALGYLNMYQSTRHPKYLREANDRLRYLIQLGPEVYGSGVRTGMIGYAFLQGYRATGNATYLSEATRIAEDCLIQPTGDLWMNGGLMCGFHLSSMYKQTSDQRYQTAARKIIERTSAWQYPNGVWPHQPHLDEGNTSYTAWMVAEQLLMRQADPGYELGDVLLAKSLDFLSHRVNPDGSLNYSDAQGEYYLDPGNLDSRFWTGELANIALDLSAGGRREQANAVLRQLFRYEMTGRNRGGYPDKYNLEGVTSIWETGSPSVVRTSLIFWYLSMIDQFSNRCDRGGTVACTVSAQSCSSVYDQTWQCMHSLPGVQTCIGGSYTSCFDLSSTHVSEPVLCEVESYCIDDRRWGACYYECYRNGRQICVNGICAGICFAVQEGEVQCESNCFEGTVCGDGGEGLSLSNQQPRLMSLRIEPGV